MRRRLNMAKRNFTDSEEEQIAKIYLSGKSARAITRAYGLRFHISIVDALRRQGIEQRPVSERNRIHKLNSNAFDKLDNEQSAYWHGFLYADGYIANNKTLSLGLSSLDIEHVESFKEFIKSEARIKTSLIWHSTNKLVSKINITDKHLANQLQQKGILKGRPYPNLIFDNLPEEMFNHWIRGLFDGDGSARRNQSICFCGSRKLMIAVRDKLSEHCGTNPNMAIAKHRTANLYYVYYSGRRVALKVADFIYKDATVWLDRKRQVINSWYK